MDDRGASGGDARSLNDDGSRRRRPWSLRRMLLASVVLHLVLFVLSLLLPTDPPAARAAEDLEVRFDLTEPPDSELFRASDPVEERPTEEPVDPAPSALGQDVPVLPEPVTGICSFRHSNLLLTQNA